VAARAGSVADFKAPPGVKTLRQQNDALIAKYGDRYLGIALEEWDNDLYKSALAPSKRYKKRRHIGEWLRQKARNTFHVPVKTREEAIDCIRAMFRVVHDTYGPDARLLALCGHFIWDHYSLEFGGQVAFPEMSNYSQEEVRLRMASARGAARQYGRPWFAYQVNKRMHKPTREYGWISASLFFRELVMAYMSGCSFYYQESGHGFERYEYDSKTRKWEPSPYMDSLVKAEELFARHPDRGVPYTPILLGLDWLHGYTGGYSVFVALRGGRFDKMMASLFNDVLWPFRDLRSPDEGVRLGYKESDNQCLGNSSFGDVFDLMVLNPPSDCATLDKLKAYKVLTLLGEIRWTRKLAHRLRDYVEGGGTLFVAVDQLRNTKDMAWCGIFPTGKTHESRSAARPDGGKLADLPEDSPQVVHELAKTAGMTTLFADETGQPLVVTRKLGQGAVVACTVETMLDKKARTVVPAAEAALQRLHDECLPIAVEGDIEFAVSRNATSWIVTLANNRGITKEAVGPTLVDHAKPALVSIRPRFQVSKVREWFTEERWRDEEVSAINRHPKHKVNVLVPPGDVRIVELVVKRR